MQTYQLKTKYSIYDCYISRGQYGNGRISISLMDASDGMKIMTATVNVPDAPLQPGEVVIKDYSENEGVYNWGIQNKIWEATGKHINTGFMNSPVVKLLQ